MPVLGHESYHVSNLGRVRGKNGKILKAGYARGYLNVVLDNKTYPVHRLVALSFVDGYAPGLVVNHIDECKHHNFAFNLEWVTQAANVEHSLATDFVVLDPAGVNIKGATPHDLHENTVYALALFVKCWLVKFLTIKVGLKYEHYSKRWLS